MPVNAGPEYFVAEKRFHEAKKREEKIAALEEMIRKLPKHKGAENVLAQLKKRLARLKKETSVKAATKPRFVIKKEGAAQVCIIGLTKSGKSTLLQQLTNVKTEVADYPYTTKLPVVGMMNFGDVQVQMIEIPSTFDADTTSILHTCDLILILLDLTQDVDRQIKELTDILSERKLDNKKILFALNKCDLRNFNQGLAISAKEKIGLEELKEAMWSRFGLIRVYTKSPGKPKVIPPITLPKDAAVRDVAKCVHKDFLKNFRFARVFDSSPFSGQKVGLDFKLKDLDVIEIHIE